MQPRTKKVIAAVIVILTILALANAGVRYLDASAKRDQNELLKQRIVELKEQNELLRENKMCLTKQSDADLADPVCGPNPDAFASPSPSPEVREHGRALRHVSQSDRPRGDRQGD